MASSSKCLRLSPSVCEEADKFCTRWARFRNELLQQWSKFCKKFDENDLRTIRTHFQAIAEIEFEYIFEQKKCLCDVFWETLMYRPDISPRLDRLLRGPEMYLEPAADCVRAAIDAAGWSEDFWISDSGPELDERQLRSALLRCWTALAGVATVSCNHLKRRGLISQTEAHVLDQLTPFTEDRAAKFALILWAADAEKVKEVLRANAFLKSAIRSAAAGEWLGPQLEVQKLPSVPDYFVYRKVMDEIRQKLKETMLSTDQQWINIYGQGGAGKTVIAKQLAAECSEGLVLWIPFGNRTAKEIYLEAKDVLRNLCPGSNPDRFASAEEFIKSTLSERTRNVVLFIDDVHLAQQLEPFLNTKTVVCTSRLRIDCPEDRTTSIEVSLSLEEEECMAIFEKVLGGDKRRFDRELITLSHTVRCNALATAASAAFLKKKGTDLRTVDIKNLSVDIANDPEQKFDLITRTIKKSVHDYDKDHLNIYRLLSVIIDSLLEPEKSAFESLIVFRRNTSIVAKVFGKMNDTECLSLLRDRSLLQHKGDEYEMHDLCRDILEAKLTKEQRQKYFRSLVEAYEGREMDCEDSFYFLEFINVCLEADRTDVAVKTLTSAKYLLARFSQCRFANVIKDCDAVLRVKDSASVTAARAFLTDPALWYYCEDRISQLRQAVFFDRGPAVDSGLLALARAEATCPLFRVEEQEFCKEDESYGETIRQKFDLEVECLAITEDGEGLVATPEGHVMLLSPQLEVLKTKSFGEPVVSAGPLTDGWLLVTRRRCLVINRDLQEDQKWSVGGEVQKAVVSSEGGVAVLLVPGQHVLLFTAVTAEGTELKEFPPDGWKIGSFAVTERAVAAVCEKKCERKILVKELSERTVIEMEPMEMFMWTGSSCCFVLDDKLLICCGRRLFLVDWKQKKIEKETKVLYCGSSYVRSSPDGRLAATLNFNDLSVFDALSATKVYFSRDMNISVNSCSISNFALLVCTNRSEIIILHRSGRSVTFPLPVRRREDFLAALWHREDFALFRREGPAVTVRTSDGSELIRWTFPDWEYMLVTVSASGDGAAVIWERFGHRLASVELQEGVRSEFRVEEKICLVALRGSLLAVGDGSGAVFVRSTGTLRRLAKVEKICELFAFSSAVGVISSPFPFSFCIFDLSGRKKFEVKGKVGGATVSSCGRRAAVPFEGEVLEVSEEGEQLRRFSPIPDPKGVHFPPEGLSVWNYDHVVVVRGERSQLKTKFPGGISGVQCAQDGALAAVRTTTNDVWLWNLHSGARELLWRSAVTKLYVIELFISPSMDRLLLRCSGGAADYGYMAVFLKNVTPDSGDKRSLKEEGGTSSR